MEHFLKAVAYVRAQRPLLQAPLACDVVVVGKNRRRRKLLTHCTSWKYFFTNHAHSGPVWILTTIEMNDEFR